MTYVEPGGGDGVAGAVTEALAGEPMLARYDANGDGLIDLAETLAAIHDYYDFNLTFGQVMLVIGAYYSD